MLVRRHRWLTVCTLLFAVAVLTTFFFWPNTPISDPSAVRSGDKPVQTQMELGNDGNGAIGYRLAIAAAYIGVLAIGALAIRRRVMRGGRSMTVASEDGELIVVRQQKKLTAQLTLYVVEVSGQKFLVAASPNAVSTTELDHH
jgi:hypothetical protein